MPIAPKYTWWEDAESVYVRLDGAPVKDQQQVFCADCVVKVNAAPYFLQLDLYGEVDEDASTAAIDRQSALLALRKASPRAVDRPSVAWAPIRRERRNFLQRHHPSQPGT